MISTGATCNLGAVALLVSSLAGGCEPPPPPPQAPSPRRPLPPSPPVSADSSAKPSPDSGIAVTSRDPGDAGGAAVGDAATGHDGAATADVSVVKVSVVLEQPYKMGQRVLPKTTAAYRADWRERRRWNDGGLGETLSKPPGPLGHPDPRVIINIDTVRGPHPAKKLQRIARKFHWMNAVRCYRLGRNEPHLRGWTNARVTIRQSGEVSEARLVQSELKSDEVAKCLVRRLKKLKFPAAGGRSRADVDIRVGPGDDPVPLPLDEQVPGDGELSVPAMRQGAAAGLEDFEACYRAAFEYAPELWGRIVIRFHLTGQGKLDEAFQTESRFPDGRVKQCVLRAARRLGFERPSNGEIRFEVPLRFFTDRSPLPAAPAAAAPDGGE